MLVVSLPLIGQHCSWGRNCIAGNGTCLWFLCSPFTSCVTVWSIESNNMYITYTCSSMKSHCLLYHNKLTVINLFCYFHFTYIWTTTITLKLKQQKYEIQSFSYHLLFILTLSEFYVMELFYKDSFYVQHWLRFMQSLKCICVFYVF